MSREPTPLDARRKARKRRAHCPICRQPSVERYLPFCSRRCADADLARWLDGSYAIPGSEPAGEPFDDGDGNERD